MVVMTIILLTLTYLPPRLSAFEDFLGYEFGGEDGILEDRTDHLAFTETAF